MTNIHSFYELCVKLITFHVEIVYPLCTGNMFMGTCSMANREDPHEILQFAVFIIVCTACLNKKNAMPFKMHKIKKFSPEKKISVPKIFRPVTRNT